MGCTTSHYQSAKNNSTSPGSAHLSPDKDTRILTPTHKRYKHRTFLENLVTGNNDCDIKKYYNIHNTILGSGVSGDVRLCEHKATKTPWALKTIRKEGMRRDKLKQFRMEVNIMGQLDHPNIIRLHEYFETKTELYLVMELCNGGELLDRLNKQQKKHYNERTACKYVQTMLSAITYCHSHNIVHRDLKLENFLFENDGEDAQFKLIDFGLSQYFHEGEIMTKSVGTAYYVSPEVLNESYDAKCDVWSLGVITYMLLSGIPPFFGRDDKETLKCVQAGRWKFNESLFRNISSEAKDFIRKCLTKRPDMRPSASSLLSHPWFDQLIRAQKTNQPSLDVISRLRGFAKRTALTRLCIEVVAHSLPSQQISDLRKEFMKYDINKNGEITTETMLKVLKSQRGINDSDLVTVFNEISKGGIIHYHDFIAATLSRRRISDENLRIAFEKISNHGEVITSEAIIRLLGIDSSEEEVEKMMIDAGFAKDATLNFQQFQNVMMGGPETPVLESPFVVHFNKFTF